MLFMFGMAGAYGVCGVGEGNKLVGGLSMCLLQFVLYVMWLYFVRLGRGGAAGGLYWASVVSSPLWVVVWVGSVMVGGGDMVWGAILWDNNVAGCSFSIITCMMKFVFLFISSHFTCRCLMLMLHKF